MLISFQATQKFYSYTYFPKFQIEVKTIASYPEEQAEIFPYRLGNLKGHQIPIVIGGSSPRIIPHTTSTGKNIIGGFVGHFIETFAQKYNCVFSQPLPFNPHKLIASNFLIEAVRNGTVEISAGLTLPEVPFRGYSYALEYINWCVMIPVEANIPGYEFFTLVFKGKTYLLVIITIIILSMILSAALYLHGHHVDIFYIFCHDNCLRGILGQAFPEIFKAPGIIRYIYIEICFLGLLFTTTYNSYFSTYVTRPPKEPSLNSLNDILRSGLKVCTWEPEYKVLVERVDEFRKYAPMFNFIQDFDEFIALRDSFNTKYGYMLPTTKWKIIKEQQKIFSQPLFRQSKDHCFVNNIPICFPIHENSIYSSLIYQLILETTQSGLMKYWSKYGFFELIAAKAVIFKDLSAKEEFQPMALNDLQYIFIFLSGMFVLVILVFLGELMVFHRRIIKKRLTRYLRRVT